MGSHRKKTHEATQRAQAKDRTVGEGRRGQQSPKQETVQEVKTERWPLGFAKWRSWMLVFKKGRDVGQEVSQW